MKSTTTDRFWKCYAELPAMARKQAKEVYNLFLRDPYYPSLHFKRVHSTRPIFSVRITKNYRAVGVLQDNEIIWFWIGSHSEYKKLLRNA
ncbi:hypothetical protein FP828_09425 [bacterium]|nr:hypothetical protein [bacterium]